MVYNGRSGGRYDGSGYGGGAGGYQRRDSSLRRSGGSSTFGAIDMGSGGGGRQSYSAGPSVSPWASGQGPNRHSWGSGSAGGPELGGRGRPDVFSQLGSVSAGGHSDTLNMATQLVSALLENQRQRAPQPFGGPAGPGPASGPFGPGPSYGARGAGGFRGGRSSFDGGRSEFGHRPDYNAKFDRRETFVSPSRGRATFRGRGATARSRPYTRGGGATPGRTAGKQAADRSGTKKKDQPKKGVKTTQEAIDEAKAAALEKEMEASDDKSKGAEGADLMSKKEVGAVGDSKDTEAKKDGESKKGDKAADAKDGEAKKTKPAKPQREKISPEYLNCTVCNVLNMKSEQTFTEHTRGRRHQLMMELMEQKLEQTAKLIRIEIQVAAKRSELEAQRRGNGKAGAASKETGFCGMCNVKVYKDIQDHRFNDPLHAKLKKFLHPRCCAMGFDTPVLYERHLLSFTHFRKTQQRDKERAAAGTEVMKVEGDPAAGTTAAAAAAAATDAAAKQNGEAAGDGTAVAAADGKAAEVAAPATEGTEGTEGAAATAIEGADGAAPAGEGDKAETPAADGQESAKEPAKEPEPEQEEEVPVMYDPEVAVATRTGSPFVGTFCTICKIVTPSVHWQEHCRSRMHYDRFVVVRAATERARKEAAEKAAAAEEAEVEVLEEEPDSEEAAATATNGEQRGTKRPAEDEDGAEAKKPATDATPTDETSLDKMLDEMSEELDGKTVSANEGEEAEKAEEKKTEAANTDQPAEGVEKAADVAEKPAAATTNTPAKPAAAAAEQKPAAAATNTPAKPAAAAAEQKPAMRGRGGRGGRGGGSPGRGGFARRRPRGRGGRF